MTDVAVVEEFENTWNYVRGMRDEFVHCVPDDKWHFTHHEKFAPLQKQFEHVVKVYGCYIEALNTGKLDMSKKKSMLEGPGTRENILSHLKKYDEQLVSTLNKLKKSGLDQFQVSLFGMTMGFSEYTHVMIHHDVSHFGMWSNYAAFGGFATPKTWQSDWKL